MSLTEGVKRNETHLLCPIYILGILNNEIEERESELFLRYKYIL